MQEPASCRANSGPSIKAFAIHEIRVPGDGGVSGLAWAEGTLWVGQYRRRKIHQIWPISLHPGSYPKTGLEGINGDLLETDFWPNVISGSPVTFPELRSPTFRSQRSVSD